MGTTALAVIAFGGGAYAAAQDPPANAQQTFLNDAAKRLDVSPPRLTAALRGAFLDQLSAAVAAGRLTKAEAEAIRQRLERKGGVPLGGWSWFGRRGFGPGMFGGPGGLEGPRGPGALGGPVGPLGPGADAAANYLGLSESALIKQLAAGKSLAQVAMAQGKSTSGLEKTLLAAARTRLERARSAGFVTSAQEQRLLQRLSARSTAEIKHAGLVWPRVFRGRARGAQVPAPAAGPTLGY